MRLACCLLAIALIPVLPARADETAASDPPKEPEAKDAPAQATAKPAASSGSSSLRVARDPETGALRPLTPEETRRLLGRRPLAKTQPQVVTLPDGTRMMQLGPEHALLSVARKNPDGTITTSCIHGTDEARAFLEAAPAPATREK